MWKNLVHPAPDYVGNTLRSVFPLDLDDPLFACAQYPLIARAPGLDPAGAPAGSPAPIAAKDKGKGKEPNLYVGEQNAISSPFSCFY